MSAYRYRALQLFSLLDTNWDQTIGVEDLPVRGADQSEMEVLAAENVRGLLRGFLGSGDRNRNGNVSKDEMVLYVEKAMAGKTADSLPDFLRRFADGAFALMDADENGKVSKSEFEQYLKARNITEPGAADEFAQLDRDGDGSLVPDDLHNAAFTFFTFPDVGCPQHWLYAAATV